jgi:hypothetical protein
MRLAIPGDAPAGPGVLRWALLEGLNAVANASAPILITEPVRPTITTTP